MTNKPLKEDLGKYKLFVQCGGGEPLKTMIMICIE